jgi:hypothetical protein
MRLRPPGVPQKPTQNIGGEFPNEQTSSEIVAVQQEAAQLLQNPDCANVLGGAKTQPNS